MNQTKIKLEFYKRILGKDFKLNNTKIYWVYEDENIRISTKNNDINNIELIKFTVNKKDSTGRFKTIWKGLIPDVSFLNNIIKFSVVDEV
jgi:hypothetical protein